MNKTKRTLIVSSVVMALILVVTVVSVTAAWFTNIADSTPTEFEISSDLLQESASISIDESVSGYGYSVWPAIANPGYLAKGNLAPYGTALKNAKTGIIDKGANCAVLYFPITFVGAPDSGATDGRKSLVLNVVYAHLGTKNEGNDDVTESEENYLSAFNVEMELVRITETDGKTVSETIVPVEPSDSSTAKDVYYYQPFFDDATKLLPSYKLYMLVNPGDTYYVKATVYFNQIDEECDEKLIYMDVDKDKSIVLRFELQNQIDSTIDIRNKQMPAGEIPPVTSATQG